MSMMLCPRCWGAPTTTGCGYCNGAMRVADQSLSKNFALSELLESPTALRQGIDNAPDATIVTNLGELSTKLLQPLRDSLGPIRVNSGYRSLALNRAVGGSSTSAHMEGNAADLNPLGASVKTAVEWLIKSSLEFDQVIYEGTWVHAGWRKNGLAKPRREVLMMFGGKYYPYDPNDPRVT